MPKQFMTRIILTLIQLSSSIYQPVRPPSPRFTPAQLRKLDKSRDDALTALERQNELEYWAGGLSWWMSWWLRSPNRRAL